MDATNPLLWCPTIYNVRCARSRVQSSGDHIQFRPTRGSHAVKKTPKGKFITYVHMRTLTFYSEFDTVSKHNLTPPPPPTSTHGGYGRHGTGGKVEVCSRCQSHHSTCGGSGAAQQLRGGSSRAERAGWRVCGQRHACEACQGDVWARDWAGRGLLRALCRPSGLTGQGRPLA